MKLKLIIVLVCLGLTLFMCSCTSGLSPVQNDSNSNQKESSSSQTDETPGVTLTIYCEDDEPMQYLDENGQLTGMAVEVVKEFKFRCKQP